MSVELADHRIHREYGHGQTAEVVNSQDRFTFEVWTRGLPRATRDVCRDRFDFLASEDVRCLPLTQTALDLLPELYAEFTRTRQPKARDRNTVNDLLLLAASLTLGRDLLTRDRLLAEFARDYLELTIAERGPGLLVRSAVSKGRSAQRDRRGSRASFRQRQPPRFRPR